MLRWRDDLLMQAGLQVWFSHENEPHISGIEFTSNDVSLCVGDAAEGGWTPPVAIEPTETLPDRIFRASGLRAPPPDAHIEVIPSSLGQYDARSYWAYLLYDLGEYGWAIIEPPHHLEYRRVERTAGGSVVTVTRGGARWVSLIPLPPAGELVGTPFEIVDWIQSDAGQLVRDHVRAAQIDKYRGVLAGFDPWARAWLDQQQWS